MGGELSMLSKHIFSQASRDLQPFRVSLRRLISVMLSVAAVAALLPTAPAQVTAVSAPPSTDAYLTALAALPSTDAYLTALAPSAGVLTPAFISTTTSYTSGVVHDVASVQLTPTLSSQYATYTITQASGPCTANVCALSFGPNVITVTVTAENTAIVERYVIVVDRAPETALSGLEISPGTLSPSFVSATTSYAAAAAPVGTSSMLVTPTVSAGLTYSVTSSAGSCDPGNAPSVCPLAIGTNLVTVTVTGSLVPTPKNVRYVKFVALTEVGGRGRAWRSWACWTRAAASCRRRAGASRAAANSSRTNRARKRSTGIRTRSGIRNTSRSNWRTRTRSWWIWAK